MKIVFLVLLFTICQKTVSSRVYPPFGHEMRINEFLFAKDYINFNHGSFGSPPREVIEARRSFEDECEARPDVFFRGGYQKYLNENREKIAEYINADKDDVVFVENASSGVNAILRSVGLQPGDLVLELSIAYGMVTNTINWLSDFEGIEVIVLDVVFPGKAQPPTGTDGRSLLESIESSLITHGSRIKLATFCLISSSPAVILPYLEISSLCKKYGVSVLIDGAHSLGHVPVDMTVMDAAGVDYWVGNGHKWLYSPKGSAVLWVSKRKQTSVVPTVISSTATKITDFLNNFEYTGTRDYTPFCAIASALNFRTAIGGDSAIMSYNRNLALWAQKYLATLWDTEVLLPDSMTSMMSHPRLPKEVTNEGQMNWLKNELLDNYNMQVTVISYVVGGEQSYWMRLSSQIYLEENDFLRLGGIVVELLGKLPPPENLDADGHLKNNTYLLSKQIKQNSDRVSKR